MRIDSFINWPEVCEIAAYTPRISVTRLLPDQKQQLWQHLKTTHPEKAASFASLMKDPQFLELVAHFDAELLLDEEFVPGNLKWLVEK